jgi:hypothetical protein
MDDGQTAAVGAWASLPLDLLLEIFRRLESTAVVHCAGACRSRRRAIIGNASFLENWIFGTPNVTLRTYVDFVKIGPKHVALDFHVIFVYLLSSL